MTIEQSHKSHTARVPCPTTYNIQNKNAHIFVLNDVLCNIGHVHCGIYENCLFIISSGSASCHHAPDLYLASNGHGLLPNKFGQNPTILIFLAGGSEASSSATPPLRDGTGGSQHRATKYVPSYNEYPPRGCLSIFWKGYWVYGVLFRVPRVLYRNLSVVWIWKLYVLAMWCKLVKTFRSERSP